MKNKRLIIIVSIVACFLLIPLIVMQFTDQVNWTLGDFVVMGGLLLATGLCIDLIMRKVRSIDKRTYIILGVLIVFLLIWAEMAVGVFGSPVAGR